LLLKTNTALREEAHDFGRAEEDDDDVPPKAMKLTEARDTFLKCKLFLEENQDDPAMHLSCLKLGRS
jgi:hypothetical protein